VTENVDFERQEISMFRAIIAILLGALGVLLWWSSSGSAHMTDEQNRHFIRLFSSLVIEIPGSGIFAWVCGRTFYDALKKRQWTPRRIGSAPVTRELQPVAYWLRGMAVFAVLCLIFLIVLILFILNLIWPLPGSLGT
jgi:ABC-type multidrug transport system permease subunit